MRVKLTFFYNTLYETEYTYGSIALCTRTKYFARHVLLERRKKNKQLLVQQHWTMHALY